MSAMICGMCSVTFGSTSGAQHAEPRHVAVVVAGEPRRERDRSSPVSCARLMILSSTSVTLRT